jgi:hypothetical protein
MSDPIDLKETIFRLQARDLYDATLRWAQEHHCTLDEILGKSKWHETVKVRHAYWHWLQDVHQFSNSSIGRLVARDESSILYGLRRHRERSGIAQPSKMPGKVRVRMTGCDRASIEELCEGGWHVFW